MFTFLAQVVNGLAVSVQKGHLSPSINEDAMLRSVVLLDSFELPYWPSMEEISQLRKAEVSLEFILRRKLVNKKIGNLSAPISYIANLREISRCEKDETGVSNKEM